MTWEIFTDHYSELYKEYYIGEFHTLTLQRIQRKWFNDNLYCFICINLTGYVYKTSTFASIQVWIQLRIIVLFISVKVSHIHHTKLALSMDRALGKQLEGIAKTLGATSPQQLPPLEEAVKVH